MVAKLTRIGSPVQEKPRFFIPEALHPGAELFTPAAQLAGFLGVPKNFRNLG